MFVDCSKAFKPYLTNIFNFSLHLPKLTTVRQKQAKIVFIGSTHSKTLHMHSSKTRL